MKTTCGLPPDGRHHEVQIRVAVDLLEQGTLRIHESVVESPLRRREIDLHGIGFAGRELPNVTPSRAIDEARERVQSLDSIDHRNPLGEVQRSSLDVC